MAVKEVSVIEVTKRDSAEVSWPRVAVANLKALHRLLREALMVSQEVIQQAQIVRSIPIDSARFDRESPWMPESHARLVALGQDLDSALVSPREAFENRSVWEAYSPAKLFKKASTTSPPFLVYGADYFFEAIASLPRLAVDVGWGLTLGGERSRIRPINHPWRVETPAQRLANPQWWRDSGVGNVPDLGDQLVINELIAHLNREGDKAQQELDQYRSAQQPQTVGQFTKPDPVGGTAAPQPTPGAAADPRGTDQPESVNYPELVIDRSFFEVRVGAKRCRLGNTKPFQLIKRLATANGRYVSVANLLEDVWIGTEVQKGTVQRTISYLRTALKKVNIHEYILDGTQHDHYALLPSPTSLRPGRSDHSTN